MREHDLEWKNHQIESGKEIYFDNEKYVHINIGEIETKRKVILLYKLKNGEIKEMPFPVSEVVTTIFNVTTKLWVGLKCIDSININISYSSDMVDSDEQFSYNEFYNIKGEVIDEYDIYYSEKTFGKPKKLVVCFPDMASFKRTIKYPARTYDEIEQKTSNYKIISLQDRNETYGNYMKKRYDGTDLAPTIYKFIKKKYEEIGLQEKDVIFIGSSKGASICLDYVSYMPNSNYFSICPQLDINHYVSHFPITAELFESYDEKYSYIEMLKKLENKNVRYYYGTNDELCTLGTTKEDFPGISAYECVDCDHAGVYFNSIDKIVDEIAFLINGKNKFKEMINTFFKKRRNIEGK